MKSKLKYLLIPVGVALSYFFSNYAGSMYTYFFGVGNVEIGSEYSWNIIIGFPLSLIFFLTLFGSGFIFKNKKSTLILISPILLWELSMDFRHFYIPVALVLIGFGISSFFIKYRKV